VLYVDGFVVDYLFLVICVMLDDVLLFLVWILGLSLYGG